MRRLFKLAFFSQYPRDAYMLMLASFINSTGSSLMFPLITLYVHNNLHRTYGEAGFVIFCQSLAGIVGQLVGGSIYHKLGVKKLLIGALLLQCLGQFGLIFATDWFAYIMVMTLNGFLMSITMPTISAFIGFRFPNQQYRLFNVIYVSNNAGVALGTALAGLLATISYNLTFLLNGISTLVFAGFFFFYLRRIDITNGQESSIGALSVHPQKGMLELLRAYPLYLFIALGSMLLWFSTSVWGSGVAPYLNARGMSLSRYSFLWTVNGLMIIFGQQITARLNRTITRSLPTRLVASAMFYAIAFFFLMFFHLAYYNFIIVMLVATLGEMLVSPTIPAIVTKTTGHFAPFYLGLIGGFGSLGRLIGPVLFGTMFDFYGISPILFVTVATASLAAVSFYLHKKISQSLVME